MQELISEFILPDNVVSEVNAFGDNRSVIPVKTNYESSGFWQNNIVRKDCFYLSRLNIYLTELANQHHFSIGTDFSVLTCWPGQSYERHKDLFRVIHIPVYTNDKCYMIFGTNIRHLPIGKAYLTNTLIEHSACNLGNTPRTHILVSVQ